MISSALRLPDLHTKEGKRSASWPHTRCQRHQADDLRRWLLWSQRVMLIPAGVAPTDTFETSCELYTRPEECTANISTRKSPGKRKICLSPLRSTKGVFTR